MYYFQGYHRHKGGNERYKKGKKNVASHDNLNAWSVSNVSDRGLKRLEETFQRQFRCVLRPLPSQERQNDHKKTSRI